MDDIVSILRSCLITSKTGTTIDQLRRDYREVEGKHIPFRDLGFNSLEELLRSRPDAFRVYIKNGQTHVDGLNTPETAHIKALVARQKTGKKKGKPLGNYQSQQRKPNATKSVSNSYTPYTRNMNPPQPVATRSAPTVTRKSNIPPPKNDSTPQLPKKPVSPPRAQAPSNEFKPNPVPQLGLKITIANISSPAQAAAAPQVARPAVNSRLAERLVIKSPPVVLNPPKPPESPQAPSLSIPVPTVVKFRDDDPRKRLIEMVMKLNISQPQYAIKKLLIHGKEKLFCSISMESDDTRTSGISSYPKEAETAEDAEKLAAAAALDVLREVYDRPVPKTITGDKNVIKQRIISIVDEHGGVFESQIPVYYMNKYNEILPDYWATIITNFPKDLTFETNPIGDSRILYRYDPAIHQADSMVSDRLNDRVPSKMIFPTDEFVPVSIVHVASTTEIWANIIGVNYSDLSDAMSLQMAEMYSKSRQPAERVISGQYYVANDIENCSWERVRVESVNRAGNIAQVFFIDTGYRESIDCKLLYPFDEYLCSVPPQAVQLAMVELECLSGFETVTNIVSEYLLHQRCYINNPLHSANDGPYSAIFYDTSGVDDLVIHEEVKKKIIHKFEADKFKTRTNVKVFEVSISHVDNENIYVQIKNNGFEMISCLIEDFLKINNEILTTATVICLDGNDMHLVQCENGNWVRARRNTRLENNTQYEMERIDIGGSVMVNRNRIVHIKSEGLCMLAKFPDQAHLVTLQNINKSSFDMQTVERLIQLAPPDLILVCKVVSDFPKPPSVELFKRSQPENALISINNTLALIPELEKSNGDGNNNVKPMKKRLERANSRPNFLPKPAMSPNELNEVRVTDSVVSPSHFFVHPRKQLAEFKSMMLEMQKCYNSYTGMKLTVDSVREATLCAAKYAGRWYRVYINGIIGQEIAVYLCDYGQIVTVSIDDLLPLQSKFCNLPYQAIKTQLHGIKPKHGDWSPWMCTRFRDLVAGKDFFAQVYKIEEDEDSPTKLIVHLELVDTSTAEDIHIRERLVKEQIVILTSAN